MISHSYDVNDHIYSNSKSIYFVRIRNWTDFDIKLNRFWFGINIVIYRVSMSVSG